MKTLQFNHTTSLVFTLLLTCIACVHEKTTGISTSTPDDTDTGTIQSVEVVTPQQRAFRTEIQVTGTALAHQQIVVYAMESGYVQHISKDIGDLVRKGELIAILRNPELERLHEQKVVQLKAKKTTYERLKSIRDATPALTPMQILEDAETEYSTMVSELNAIEDRLEFLHVKAPFAGRITKRMLDHGALVQSGLTEDNPQGIVELQEINPIRLVIPLPESDIAALDTKEIDVEVTFPGLSGDPFRSKVSRNAGALDPASKTMHVEIDLANPSGHIKPGMYAKVLLKINSRENVLSLPITAQWISQNQTFVLAVIDNHVHAIPLRKGLSDKDYFEVLNTDITAQSQVIVQGKALIHPGQIVIPVLKSE
ncbi:MAG TPA: efflux RND transporter periplasmic adaptor subunit [Saprospiraceae bacterium]|nr:efflux RND transporter periplasmic adaptor subunit [Saprospiraceae bacterium]